MNIVIDFYNKYDNFTRLLNKRSINNYNTIELINITLEALIKVYEANLYDQIDKSVLYNLLMCSKICVKRFNYNNNKNIETLKNNLNRLSDLKYDVDNNIKR